MISLLQASEYRPYPNRFIPAAYESAVRLQNGCYVPRWEMGPQDSVQPLPARGYTSGIVRLRPGSFVLAVSAALCQITDMGSGLTFFDQPSEYSAYLPLPRLVSEPGELKVEIWNPFTTAQTLEFLLTVAEPLPEVMPR